MVILSFFRKRKILLSLILLWRTMFPMKTAGRPTVIWSENTAQSFSKTIYLTLCYILFCCGETLEERQAEKQNEVVKAELEGSVFHLDAEAWKNIVIAYEPIWAIGTGMTATSDQAEEMLAYIRSIVAEKYGQEAAENTSILYGGSCKASNAPELFSKPNIDGGLIGGASLKCADFKGIIDAWKK